MDRTWVILQRPGRVPERKGAFITDEQVAELVREVTAKEPETVCIVLSMASGDPWPEHGGEWLQIHDHATGRAALS